MTRPAGYTITTDRDAIDLDALHAVLTASYWARGISRELVRRSAHNALCFTLLAPDGSMAGFARVVTDGAVFAHVCDVVVFDAHRGRGLGVWLMETLLAHPDLQGLRKVQLHTSDAHGLYARFGFKPPAAPETYLAVERSAAELYGR